LQNVTTYLTLQTSTVLSLNQGSQMNSVTHILPKISYEPM